MIKIIDASVAIKWFIPNEPNRGSALALLDAIADNPKPFAVPELFFNEMLAVLCRLLKASQAIEEYLEVLQDLGLERLGNGKQTLATAAQLAKKHSLSGYDAIYAANAKLTQGLWITADQKAHKKIAKLKISELLSG